MRIFVLTAGRSGSHTFARACSHATNVTTAHESRKRRYGADRLAYPDDHIEVDCRLQYFLGGLADRFPDALYVHLTRDRDATARSWLRRIRTHPPRRGGWKTARARAWNRVASMYPGKTLIYAFSYHILSRRSPWPEEERLDVARFFVDTANANTSHFLRDKRHVQVRVEHAKEDFPAFWRWAELEGDLDRAVAEWDVRYSATTPGRR